MNIKKLAISALIVTCTCVSMPSYSGTITPKIEVNGVLNETNPKTADPLVRLKEIKDMDKSNLSKAEKKNLRKELKEMKKEAKEKKNGIYLSVGAIIIIIVLLLLLL